MKRRLFCLLCGFVACMGWHMAQAGAQELEIHLPVEFETLQIIMTDERQTWLAGYTGEPMSSKPAVLQVTSEGEIDRKSTRLNSSHRSLSRMPSSA